jgi:hypothetical protein
MYARLHCFQTLDKFTQVKESSCNLQTQLAKTWAEAWATFLTLNLAQAKRSNFDNPTFERNHTPQITSGENLLKLQVQGELKHFLKKFSYKAIEVVCQVMAQLQHPPKPQPLGKGFCGSTAFNLGPTLHLALQIQNLEIFLSKEKPVQSCFQRSHRRQNSTKTGAVPWRVWGWG